jgi:oligopeptide transport system ATP-binding protein
MIATTPVQPLLKVDHLTKHFPIRTGFFSKISNYVQAVDDVSLVVHPGESLGLVGESGCGKTTVGRCILRLIEPTSGEIIFNGKNLLKLDRPALRNIRRDIQIIFQDPYASLNPRMTVGKIIAEGLIVHHLAKSRDLEARAQELLNLVGLAPMHARRYPHEFSGGQRQRIGIARALALKPKLIVCDEPVSALDVSIQAQVINLLKDLQAQFGLTYIFIAHDLAVVKHFSHRVAVMYLGKLAEVAPSSLLYDNPLHPYTIALLSSVPIPDPEVRQRRIILEGDVPTPINPPEGCRFHTRCPIGKTKELCRETEPGLLEHEPGHFAACHYIQERFTMLRSIGRA